MFQFLIRADREVFSLLNGLHAAWADEAMIVLSAKWTWLPFYAIMLAGLWYHYRLKVLPVLLALILTIVLSDQVSSALFKPYFERLRPCHDPWLTDTIHLTREGCGGMYGFVSSHAANTFGAATLLILLLRRRYPQLWYIYAWPALVGYSRIYLGAHFPLDIVGGYVVGATAAALSYKLYLEFAGRANLLKREDIRLKAKGWA